MNVLRLSLLGASVIVSCTSLGTPAVAQVFGSFPSSVDLTGAQQYGRPYLLYLQQGNTTTETGVRSDLFRYVALPFSVGSTTTIDVVARPGTQSDPVLYVYRGSFSPTSPYTGLIAADDDSGYQRNAPGLSAYVRIEAVPNQQYVLVVTTYSSGTQGTVLLTDTPATVSSESTSPETQNSTTATQEAVLRAESSFVVRGLSQRVSQIVGSSIRLGNFQSHVYEGLAAGDDPNGQFAVWSSGSIGRFQQGGVGTNFKGRLHGLIVGADYASQGSVYGVAFSVNTTAVDTTFNNGEANSKAYTVAPYYGYVINDWLTVDANVGYGRVSKETTRGFGFIKGDTSAVRMFASANLTATQFRDGFRFQQSAGYSLAIERTSAFNEDNGGPVPSAFTRLGTVTVGGQVGYDLGRFVPYASARYLRDVQTTGDASLNAQQQSTLNDSAAYEFAAGFDFLADSFTLTSEVSTEVGRRKYDSIQGLVSLRYLF